MSTSEMLGQLDKMLGGGATCNELASHPGGSSNTPTRFMCRNRNHPLPPARLDGLLSSERSLYSLNW